MDFVIAGDNVSCRVDHERPVREPPIWVVCLKRERPDRQPNPQRGCLGAQTGQRGIISLKAQNGLLVAATNGNAVSHFGCQDKFRTLPCRIPHHSASRGQVCRWIIC